jgi:hypothetical protein
VVGVCTVQLLGNVVGGYQRFRGTYCLHLHVLHTGNIILQKQAASVFRSWGLSSYLVSKNLKINKTYKTIILPTVLYGCETWVSHLKGSGEYLDLRGI